MGDESLDQDDEVAPEEKVAYRKVSEAVESRRMRKNTVTCDRKDKLFKTRLYHKR